MPPFTFVLIESLKESVSLFLNYWWIFSPIALWPIFKLSWVSYVQEKQIKKIKWDLLEIKISQETEKRPKTMEEFFAGIYSTYDVMIDTLYDIYIGGVVDLWFSLEIVSIGGDIRFYIRTPVESREMIESQIYAQYPEAEIKEVEDYVMDVPDDIPSEDYELWGTDMILGRDDAYPIRTYKEFEDSASGEFVDPISNIIEGVEKLSKEEQIWIQILIRATDDAWKEDAIKVVEKLIGKKSKSSNGGFFSLLISEVVDFGRYVIFGIFQTQQPTEKSELKKEDEPPSLMLYLSPGEKDVVAAIEDSIKKPGFETDIRWIYLSKRNTFDKIKGNSITFSYFSQFGSKNLNNFIPDPETKTSAYYFFTEFRKAIRKRSILRKYKKREFDRKGYVLNTEELATLFHFPTFEVKAPIAPVIEAKKSKPPSKLPM